MIHTAYFHGDDQPATQLSPRQIQAARRDPASALWIDLDRASAAETERLFTALGSQPDWVTVRELLATARAGERHGADGPTGSASHPGGDGALDALPIDIWIDGAMVITRHPHDSDVVRRFAARLEPFGGTLSGGAATLLASLGEALADAYEAAMQPSDVAQSDRILAQRTAEIERAAAHATTAFRALGQRLARRDGPGGDALTGATERLAALAASAAEDAETAHGAAATSGLAEAVAAATRQLRLTQFIMLAALGLLAIIAFQLWRIAGALP